MTAAATCNKCGKLLAAEDKFWVSEHLNKAEDYGHKMMLCNDCHHEVFGTKK